MTKPLPWSGPIALLSLLPAALLPLLFGRQRSLTPVPAGRFHPPQSRFHDWSTHPVFYPHSGTLAELEAVRRDPRAQVRWLEMEQRQALERQARWLEWRPNSLQDVLLLIPPSNLGRSNINAFPTVLPTVPAAGVINAASTGITGMVVDNASGSNQASSLYFASLGNHVAMKLTQAGFR
jgi:hypothetical protein